MQAPPGAVLLAVAYGAGLMTGLLHFPDPVIATTTLLAAAWVLRRSAAAGVLLALVAGGVAGAAARNGARASCAGSLPLGDQLLQLRTIDPGVAAGRVAVRRCRGEVMARWPTSARIGSGHDVTVRARWLPRTAGLGRPDGLLIVRQVISLRSTPGPIDSLRTSLAAASASLYGSRAPLVDALITGRRGGLDPALVRDFAAAGLVHLLAISGSHIAVIAGWVLLLLRLVHLPRHPSEAIAVLCATAYTAFIGWPPSALRASALMALLAYCRWRQRHVRAVALLAASAMLVLLIDPWAIVDIGAWLSLLALAGVNAATRWSDRAFGPAGWIRTLSGSLGATLTTAPLTAFAFGQVAPIGILLNVVAVPLTAILVPLLLLSLFLWSWFPAIAASLAASGSLLVAALSAVARVGANAPGAATAGSSGWQAAIPWVAALVVAGWLIAGGTTPREATRRGAWAATAALWILLLPGARPLGNVGSGRLALLFVDVGQGDAALIRTPGGHWFAVDAGPMDRSGLDAGRRVLLPLLARERVARLDGFILSHAHRDHVGGARAVVEQVALGGVVEPGEQFSDSAYDGWLTALAARGVRWHPARAGTEWTVDGVRFRVLHPPLVWPRQGDDLNEDSVVLAVSYGAFTALLMGDAGFVAESALAGKLPRADVLKVGHHGSRGATSAAFLRATQAAVGIISVGKNGYGHPAPATLERLAAAAVRVWRTDRDGSTTVVTDGKTFDVHSGRTSASFVARARSGPRRRRARTHQGHHAGTLHPRTGAGSSRCDRGADQPAL